MNKQELFIMSKGIFFSDNPIIYDAFVCYNPDAEGKDGYFVQQCIKQLEHKHGLKLCIPIRDCLAGGAKYMMDAELIKAR